jgi:hypothetical protein
MDDTELKRQIGPDVEVKLRRLALEAVKHRAINPTELEAEIVKFFEARQGASQPISGPATEIVEHGYIEAPLERPPSFNYREALNTHQEYDYGDFLVKPFDSNGWRFTPEMLHADTDFRPITKNSTNTH